MGASPTRLCRQWILHGNRQKRTLNSKRSTSTRTTLDGNRSAVLANNPLRNGKAQSGAALSAAARFVDAVEAFKDLQMFLLRNA